MKSNSDLIRVKGKVLENLPNTMFRVELEDGRRVLASLKGTLRRKYVRVFPGDVVVLEIPSYDQERGRIIEKIGR